MIKLLEICNEFIAIPAIFVIITVHSFTKAAVSSALGDNIPKANGRLSLNPFKHIEPLGLLLMFFYGGLGWDKPIRTSSLHYKNRKKATILVSCLPVVACLITAFIATFVSNHFLMGASTNLLILLKNFLSCLAVYGLSFSVFNLIPIYPLDGSAILKAFMSPDKVISFNQMEGVLQMILIFSLILGFLDTIILYVVSFLLTLFALI